MDKVHRIRHALGARDEPEGGGGRKDTIERAEIRSSLARGESGPAEARRVVKAALTKWDLLELEHVACLLVSELVANVVLHTESRSELTLRRDGARLYVGVGDDDSRLPSRRKRLRTAATGRGLALVDELSMAWGATPADEGAGKVVWFELHAGANEAASGVRDGRARSQARTGGDLRRPAPDLSGR